MPLSPRHFSQNRSSSLLSWDWFLPSKEERETEDIPKTPRLHVADNSPQTSSACPPSLWIRCILDRNQTKCKTLFNIVKHGGQTSKTCFIKQCWMMFYGDVLLAWTLISYYLTSIVCICVKPSSTLVTCSGQYELLYLSLFPRTCYICKRILQNITITIKTLIDHGQPKLRMLKPNCFR